jgi:hypothetical protein
MLCKHGSKSQPLRSYDRWKGWDLTETHRIDKNILIEGTNLLHGNSILLMFKRIICGTQLPLGEISGSHGKRVC